MIQEGSMAGGLFSSYQINKAVITNRFTRSATAERSAKNNGEVSDDIFKIYRELGKGKIGLLISGHCYVHPSGKSVNYQNGIYDDSLMLGWSRLVEVLADDNPETAFFVQLSHGGRQVVNDVNKKPLAPSAVPLEKMGSFPVEMTEDDIEMIIDSFAQASVRAKRIGFDGIQLQCGHGFLINQFLSPRTNHRKDKWGGNPENRMRFLVEIIKRIRAKIGADYPFIIRINGADYVENGLTIEDTLEIFSVIQDLGIDAVEISGGTVESEPKFFPVRKDISNISKEAYFLPEALKILEIAKIPILLAGGIRSLATMEKLLKLGITSVSMSRPFIKSRRCKK
jgi:2,4-dienoyl-CoA reductase-like NADH-dependent reductase (Old Yellow Enzyme family)